MMPLTFWLIPTEDIEWFCNTSQEDMRIHWNMRPEYTGSQAEDDSWYVDIVLEGKDYVEKTDEVIHQRDLVMCRDPICACDVDNWSLWDNSLDTRNLYKDDNGVKDWNDCQERINAATSSSSTGSSVVVAVGDYFDGVLSLLENEFNCQGICKTGDFWLFKDVALGQVNNSCL
jgi:hypothetical protein